MKYFNQDMAIGMLSTLAAVALAGAIVSSCHKQKNNLPEWLESYYRTNNVTRIEMPTNSDQVQTNDYVTNLVFTNMVHFGKSWDELERLGYFHRKPASDLITVTETDGRESAFNVFDIQSILPMGGNPTNYFIILKSGYHREVPNEVAHNVIKVWQSKMR